MLKLFVILLVLIPFSANASSPQGEAINKNIPNAKLVGEGTYSKLFWDIYKAMLFAPDGKYTGQNPYALSITYLVEIKGKDIADRTVSEMKATGVTNAEKLEQWEKSLSQILPDVKDGSNLTAIAMSDGSTAFYSEGTKIGEVKDKEFAPAFFGIWLKQNSSDKELRQKLLGDRK